MKVNTRENGRGLTARPVASTRVYEELRLRILHGQYEPGERLTEERLAEAFQASRTPVRDAIRQLEQDGLVVIEPFRGAVVRAFRSRDIEEIFSLRVLLEGKAAGDAARLMSEAQLAELSGIVARQQAAVTDLGGSDLVAAEVALNREFHLGIVLACENNRLESIYKNLSDVPIYWRSRYWENAYQRAAGLTYHQELVDAIRARDAARAEAVMRGHILGAQEYFLQELREREENEGEVHDA